MSRKAALCVLLFLSVTTTVLAQQLKGDPWIFQAYKELYNRQPNAWEVQIKLYNNGSWNNYNELKQYVQDYQSSLSGNGISVSVVAVNSSSAAALLNQNGKTIAADLISQDGAGIIAQGGGNLIAQGGGNVSVLGGVSLKDVPGASLGSNRQLMSGDKKIIKTSGGGAIIIR